MSSAQPGYGIGAGELWQHSAATAVAGRVLAPEIGLDSNLLFTAALLHDLGKLALSATLQDRYDEITTRTAATNRSFLEVEQELLGTDHAVIGGRLLERWSFPQELCEAVRHHHDPLQSKNHAAVAAGVHLADMLAHLVGFGFGHSAYAIRAHPESLSLLKLAASDIEPLIVKTQSAMSEFELLKTR
jgi:putative nucleotidyltransferase with HDIG domain